MYASCVKISLFNKNPWSNQTSSLNEMFYYRRLLQLPFLSWNKHCVTATK